MANLNILWQLITATSLFTASGLTGMIIGHRHKEKELAHKYPAIDSSEMETEKRILEDDAAIYELEKKKSGELCDSFKILMEEEKPFLQKNTTIESVAASLGTNKTTLSKMISNEFKINFRQLLNSYRVKEALDILSKNPEMPMDELMAASGFKSVSTFTSSFSRFTGCTPGEYYKKNVNR